MSRGLTTPEISATTGPHRAVAPLVELNFDSGVLRLTLAPWSITEGGRTWLASNLLRVRDAREATGSVEGLEFSMSGIDPAIITLASQERYRGRIVRLLKAYFNTTTNQIVAAPRAWFIGRMKHMNIEESNDKCTVTLIAEHYEAELQRAAPLRLNDADQQRFYPGDKGCEHVERMAELKLVWPSRTALARDAQR